MFPWWKTLDLQVSLFKLTIRLKPPKAIAKPHDQNLVTKVLTKLASNALLCNTLSEYIKFGTDIAMLQVIGSVEDKRTFFTLSFIKYKLWNRLSGTWTLPFACMHYHFIATKHSVSISHILIWDRSRFKWVQMSRVTWWFLVIGGTWLGLRCMWFNCVQVACLVLIFVWFVHFIKQEMEPQLHLDVNKFQGWL